MCPSPSRFPAKPSPNEPDKDFLILLVEDDADVSELLCLYFHNQGWRTHRCSTSAEALTAFRSRSPDFIVLDVSLDKAFDGFDFCRSVRSESDTPVLILSGHGDESSRLKGLELGADDYVVKPFSPKEIVARVKTIMRRGRTTTSPRILRWGPIGIDLELYEVDVDGQSVNLTARETRLLMAMVEHRGRVLSRDQLLNLAWGPDWVGDVRTVDVHVSQLRTKLGPDLPITTKRQMGYRFG